jgi:hypothetical protein
MWHASLEQAGFRLFFGRGVLISGHPVREKGRRAAGPPYTSSTASWPRSAFAAAMIFDCSWCGTSS